MPIDEEIEIRPVRTVRNLSKRQQTSSKIAESSIGANNTALPEQVATIPLQTGQKIIQNGNNACILLQRDSTSNPMHGYGGRGHSSCGSISMIVGRPTNYGYAYPNIDTDSATLYISQKSDIDKNMSIAPGKIGMSTAESAIAMKADSVRMTSRFGIKIVTGLNPSFENGPPSPIMGRTMGIELNAGNQDGTYVVGGKEISALQPIPKGDNLVLFLKQLSERVDDLSAALDKFIDEQKLFNQSAQTHVHPFHGVPSPVLMTTHLQISHLFGMFPKNEISTNRKNIATDSDNYLEEAGQLYINSTYNRTT